MFKVYLCLAMIAGLLSVSAGPGIESAEASVTGCTSNGTYVAGFNSTTGLMVAKFEVGSTKTSNATCTFVVPAGITSVRVLSISGGGGGGWDGGGGGGGGGVNKYDNYAVTPLTPITITVGGGGTAATSSAVAGNGGESSFNNERAAGGAGGGSKLSDGRSNSTGSAGGAGHTNNNSIARAGGTATKSPVNVNFENNGGSSIGDYGGGGGGGSAAGGNATTTAAGVGGAGFYSSLEGAGATYAGGGGGGTWKAATATSGGSGGGGAGGTQDANGVQGTDGTGGGGGGGGRVDTNRVPGRGGSGVVLISYRNTDTCSTTSSSSGGYTTVVIANTTSQLSNCQTTWSTPSGVTTAQVVVVAGGGGGGGMYVAGGGGAGGYIYSSTQSVSGSISIQVGGGGKGGETLPVESFPNSVTVIGNSGFDGGNSVFGSLTATGGGGGGSHNVFVDGRSGGSGGGGAPGASSPSVGSGGSATASQGNAGAAGAWNAANPGGGGGGFGSAGSLGTSTTGGAGGSGTALPISGVSVSSTSVTTVAAGGGGGSDNLGGTGGSSVGGGGGAIDSAGLAGVAHTGSGGGGAGGGAAANARSGGNGSAGIVVIRYLNPATITQFDVQIQSDNPTLVPDKSVTSLLSSNYSASITAYQSVEFTVNATASGGGTLSWQINYGTNCATSSTMLTGASGNSVGSTKSIQIYVTARTCYVVVVSYSLGGFTTTTTSTYQFLPQFTSTVLVTNSSAAANPLSGTVGSAYASNPTRFAVTGGAGSWFYYSTGLPAGLSINSSTGEFTGTYTTTGRGSGVYIEAIDANGGKRISAGISWTVSAGPALTPEFGAPTATSDGFTVSITNYSASYTWATPTVSAGSVTVSSASSSTRVLTVTGLAAGASATITQNTTRSQYTNGSATVTGTSIPTYAITLGTITRVSGDTESTIGISSTPVASGATVTLTVSPKTGMRLKAGTLVATFNSSNTANLSGTGPFTFTMPAFAVTVTAQFELVEVAPSAPSSLSASAGNGQVNLSWSAPASDGGSAISDYLIQYSTDGTSFSTFSDGTSTSTSATVTGLTNGTTYTFKVSGINAIGTGSASSTASATPQASQTITRTSTTPIAATVFGTYTPTATSSSSLSVVIAVASSSSSICSISGGVVTFNGAGSCVLEYSQSGNSAFTAATQITETFSISKASQSVTWSPGTALLSTDSPATPSSLASALGSVSITYSVTSAGTTGCSVNSTSGVLTFTAAGSCTVRASAAENASYVAAFREVTFSISQVFATVTFDSNYGVSPTTSTQSNAIRVSTSLSSNSFIRSGYTFQKWNTEANGGGTDYLDGATYPFSVNATLYAQWSRNPLTITFDSQGGSPITASTVSIGANLSDPGDPTREGYGFRGWGLQVIGGVPISFPYTISETADFTLYALWTADVYTISFDGNGGGVGGTSTTINYTYGDPALELPSASRSEFTFNGWYTSATGGSRVGGAGSSFTPAQNRTLYAQWTAITYTVTYSAPDKDGGAVPVDSLSPYSNGSQIQLLGNTGGLTRSGYSFVGWRTSADASTRIPNSQFRITANVTFIAVWLQGSTLSFNANGGTGSMNTITGASVTIPENSFIYDGYSFAGWNTAADGSGTSAPVGATVPLPINVTLYAQWNLIPTNIISFASISSKSFGDTFSASVSTTSGLAVTIVSTNNSICTVSGMTITAVGRGTCSLTASQAGDSTYPTASTVTRSFSIGRKSLVITVNNVNATVGTTPANPSYSQSGLITSFGDSISLTTYKYAGTGGTFYPNSSNKPSTLGSYRIIASDVTFTSGSADNYSVTYVDGTLTISGESTKTVSGISLKSTGVNRTTELLSSFTTLTSSYSVYVAADVTAVSAIITRPTGSSLRIEVRVNDSGSRRLNFVSNSANSGALPLPLSENIVVISAIATDLSRLDYTIRVYRDTPTLPTGGSIATPAPSATPVAAGQVLSAVRFSVNVAGGVSEVAVTPNFSRTTYSYSASFSVNQSATQLRADFTGVGITLRLKTNSGPFLPIPSTGSSSTVALNKGANTAILRVTSSDGTSVDYTFTLTRASS